MQKPYQHKAMCILDNININLVMQETKEEEKKFLQNEFTKKALDLHDVMTDTEYDSGSDYSIEKYEAESDDDEISAGDKVIHTITEVLSQEYSIWERYSNRKLKEIFKYKEKDKQKYKGLFDNLEQDYTLLLEKYQIGNSWKKLVIFYWTGFLNNVILKRKYLKYHEEVSRLMEKLEYLHQSLNKKKEDILQSEKIEFNEYETMIELDSIYTILNQLLLENIVFMTNAKAPIGDFFESYKEVKKNILLHGPLKENLYYIDTLCGIEIRNSYLRKNEKFVVKNYYKYLKREEKIEQNQIEKFEKKFKKELEEDKKYIRKEYFLHGLTIKMKKLQSHMNLIGESTKPNKEEYSLIRYMERQDKYRNLIEKLLIFNKLIIKSKVNKKESDLVLDLLSNQKQTYDLHRYAYFIESELYMLKEICSIDENIVPLDYENELISLIISLSQETNIKKDIWEEYNVQTNVKINTFIKRKWFWKEYNIRLINDIVKICNMLLEMSLVLSSDIDDIITTVVRKIKNYMIKLLEIEESYESKIIQNTEEILINNKEMYEKYKTMDEPLTKIFNEKEIWWYYFKYPKYFLLISNSYNEPVYEFEQKPNNKYYKDNPIRDYSYKYNYRVQKEYNRPELPIDIDFSWEEMINNMDKVDYSKRQQKYKQYFNKEGIISNEVNTTNNKIVKMDLLIESVRKTQDIINQLDKMGEFIKYGVLINDQLFFKFILFGINVLIFIGQYFWNTHIEPVIKN